MSVTIGAFSSSNLLAQPYGYDETETRAGLTARKWIINGLLTKTQWSSLLNVYNTWRNTRINDVDTLKSRVVGTTVSVTVSANNITVTALPCWFIAAPSGEQAGAYVNATVEVVDAAQALQVLLAEEEKRRQREDALRPDLGTLNIGGTILELLKPKDTFTNNPQVQLTAAGRHYISGPLTVSRIIDAEGETTEAGWANLRTWYENIVRTTPLRNTLYPYTVPEATARAEIQSGVKTTIYTVTIQLIRI
jgi:hypothetical protein